MKTKKLERAAFHEAGHAVAALGFEMAVKSVTIEPDFDSEGTTWVTSKIAAQLDGGVLTPDEIRIVENEILVLLAGPAAESRVDVGYEWRGAGSDLDRAYRLAGYLYEGKVLDRYLDFMVERAKQELESDWRWNRVCFVADRLLKVKTIEGSNLDGLIEEADLARSQSNRKTV